MLPRSSLLSILIIVIFFPIPLLTSYLQLKCKPRRADFREMYPFPKPSKAPRT